MQLTYPSKDPKQRQVGDLSSPNITRNPQTTFSPSDLANPPQSDFGGPSASSGGGPSPLGQQPYIPPDQMAMWADKMANTGIMYSLPAGGYISTLNPWTGKPPSEADLNNANSAYNKFGPLNANNYYIKSGEGSGGDPAANKRATDFYGALGELPTAGIGSPALQQFNQQHELTPRLGPSYNEQLGHPWQGPWGINTPPNRNFQY